MSALQLLLRTVTMSSRMHRMLHSLDCDNAVSGILVPVGATITLNLNEVQWTTKQCAVMVTEAQCTSRCKRL